MVTVIFDMDGVLFDSENTLMACWIETAARYGIAPERVRETYVRCIGTNRNQSTAIYREAFLAQLGEETTRRMWDESFALHAARYGDGQVPLKPGVRELLRFLKERAIPVGLASSSPCETIERRLAATGLAAYFVGFVGGEAVRISKPDPEIYRLACRSFGFLPAQTFAIEDSHNGIRSASAAGLRPIMVPDILPADGEMRALAETVCADLFEVMAYLKQAAIST